MFLTQFLCLLSSPVIYYDLTLDALRAKARASFIDSDEKTDRRITRNLTIMDREGKCVEETFMMSASTLNFFSVNVGPIYVSNTGIKTTLCFSNFIHYISDIHS